MSTLQGPSRMEKEAEAKTGFTPGPWKVFTNTGGDKIIGIGELNGGGVADCGFGVWRGGDAEALANALLIASAPDLYEAAKAGRQAAADLASLMREGAHDKEEIHWCKVVDNIDAALARARGENP